MLWRQENCFQTCWSYNSWGGTVLTLFSLMPVKLFRGPPWWCHLWWSIPMSSRVISSRMYKNTYLSQNKNDVLGKCQWQLAKALKSQQTHGITMVLLAVSPSISMQTRQIKVCSDCGIVKDSIQITNGGRNPDPKSFYFWQYCRCVRTIPSQIETHPTS